uniref:Activin_recp domain-containing protein n=1 Tax=Steinernema glaseri TaxID=37863 RepID=A0A1I7YY30_9BILA
MFRSVRLSLQPAKPLSGVINVYYRHFSGSTWKMVGFRTSSITGGTLLLLLLSFPLVAAKNDPKEPWLSCCEGTDYDFKPCWGQVCATYTISDTNNAHRPFVRKLCLLGRDEKTEDGCSSREALYSVNETSCFCSGKFCNAGSHGGVKYESLDATKNPCAVKKPPGLQEGLMQGHGVGVLIDSKDSKKSSAAGNFIGFASVLAFFSA